MKRSIRPASTVHYVSGASPLAPAVGDSDGFITIINTKTHRVTHELRATLRGPVWALSFSADGKNIHAGGLDDAMYSWPLDQLNKHAKMARDKRAFLNNPDDMDNGERQFARKCSIGHSLTHSSKRRAGIIADYRYSDILSGSSIIWNEQTIDTLFDLGPDHYILDSKMPMQRIANPRDKRMKTMWIAFATIAVIAVAAPFALERAGFSSADMTAGDNVRLN